MRRYRKRARNGRVLFAIGNGTASRETEAFIADVLRDFNARSEGGAACEYAVISEAGVSVYSVSEAARAELADMDCVHRGAVSLARRLLDPLSELVKVCALRGRHTCSHTHARISRHPRSHSAWASTSTTWTARSSPRHCRRVRDPFFVQRSVCLPTP